MTEGTVLWDELKVIRGYYGDYLTDENIEESRFYD